MHEINAIHLVGDITWLQGVARNLWIHMLVQFHKYILYKVIKFIIS